MILCCYGRPITDAYIFESMTDAIAHIVENHTYDQPERRIPITSRGTTLAELWIMPDKTEHRVFFWSFESEEEFREGVDGKNNHCD